MSHHNVSSQCLITSSHENVSFKCIIRILHQNIKECQRTPKNIKEGKKNLKFQRTSKNVKNIKEHQITQKKIKKRQRMSKT